MVKLKLCVYYIKHFFLKNTTLIILHLFALGVVGLGNCTHVIVTTKLLNSGNQFCLHTSVKTKIVYFSV